MRCVLLILPGGEAALHCILALLLCPPQALRAPSQPPWLHMEQATTCRWGSQHGAGCDERVIFSHEPCPILKSVNLPREPARRPQIAANGSAALGLLALAAARRQAASVSATDPVPRTRSCLRRKAPTTTNELLLLRPPPPPALPPEALPTGLEAVIGALQGAAASMAARGRDDSMTALCACAWALDAMLAAAPELRQGTAAAAAAAAAEAAAAQLRLEGAAVAPFLACCERVMAALSDEEGERA